MRDLNKTSITGIYLDGDNYLSDFTINQPGIISTDGIGWAAGATMTFPIKSTGYEDVIKTVTFINPYN